MTHQHQPYCRQLLLECNDPIFLGPLFRARQGGLTKKGTDLASPNSEDAVTRSVFRLLERHFADLPWLSELLVLSGVRAQVHGSPRLSFWEKGCPPRSRLLWLLDNTDHPRVAESRGACQDPGRLQAIKENRDTFRQRIHQDDIRGKSPWVLEGPTEFDTVIRCPGLLVVVEAKLFSDVATEVKWDKGRDQISRVIDAGGELAAQQDELAFLLVTDRRRHSPPKHYEGLMSRYQSQGVGNLPPQRLGWLTWGEIHGWLVGRRQRCTAEQQRWMDRLGSYLAQRSLLGGES